MANYLVQKVSDGSNLGYIAPNAYFECTTAASTAGKIATSTNSVSFTNASLIEGVTIQVYFSETNTAQNPTLQVGSAIAKSLVRADAGGGSHTRVGETVVGSWKAGSIVTLTYRETPAAIGGGTVGVWVVNDHSEAVGSIIVGSTTLVPQEYSAQTATGSVDITDAINDLIDAKLEEKEEYFLTFSSSNTFSCHSYGQQKHWDGTLEYSTNKKTWTSWTGEIITAVLTSSNQYKLYLRGSGNSYLTNGQNTYWFLTGSNISCIGNIETLLDYNTVESGNHPTMGNDCYAYLFFACSALIRAPRLPAPILTEGCYRYMFSTTSLTIAPELPATTLAIECYDNMFMNCQSLITSPDILPASILTEGCYKFMFYGCTSLEIPPKLPASILAYRCYHKMFSGCTALTLVPELPAQSLAEECYSYMFENCTALTSINILPVLTLPSRCYAYMYHGCTAIKISNTKTGEYQTAYRIPINGNGTLGTDSLYCMFNGTGGTASYVSINSTCYTSNSLVTPHVPVLNMPAVSIGNSINPIYWDGSQFVPTSLNNADTTSY